jgi:membrane-associated phospholipid phosphatase/predicted MFS family arabinose efflux permease
MSTVTVAAIPAGRRPLAAAVWTFAAVAVGLGAGRAVTTTYVPVLLERIADRPGLIGAVMLVNAVAGFFVPLATGLWSDRAGRRGPFIAGGALLAAGGLVAVALGTASSYAVLALAAATVYIGLNAASTAHRALVAERFAPDRRAAATGAQEGAMLAGALAGTLAGGVLIDSSAGSLFLLWAVALVVLALPTMAWQRQGPEHAPQASADSGASLRLLAEVLRRPGTREVLLAQTLWVGSYAALTPFMVLYSEEVLGLTTASAGALLAVFGVLTGVGMVLGARLGADRVRRGLLAGVALLGGGLLAATAASSVAVVAVPFGAAALGAGLVSSVGFPYFSRFIPDGQAGRYAGAFFAARAIAAAAALPVAGLVIEVTGSYRWLLGMGVLGIAALVPLARAERGAGAALPTVPAATVLRPAIRRTTAVVPAHRSARVTDVVSSALAHVDEVVVVDDGAPAALAARLDALGAQDRVRLVRLGGNHGKGTAVAAGVAAALEGAPDAVLVLDSDGQHPTSLIPAFLRAAADADVVIGDRRAARAAMPRSRRLANAASSRALGIVTGRPLPDSQNGMRLFRADVLRAVPPFRGRYEAETRHLKALVQAGEHVAWVPMPAVYDGEPSAFRALADSLRVLGAILAPARPAAVAPPAPAVSPWSVARTWSPRIALGMAFAWAVAAAFPVIGGTDERLFLAVNGLGDGPAWLYETFDPHSRNYVLLITLAVAAVLVATRSVRFAAGALLAMVASAVFADLVMELIQLGVDRPRPEEALGGDAQRSHDRHWAHIPSFPSGHLMVTAGLVATAATLARRLRGPLLVYLGAVAVTRVLFGAHFPLDVVVGALVGWQVGLFAVALIRSTGLLPAAPEPAPESGLVPASQPA